MKVEYKACILQFEETAHQDIQQTYWCMHADKMVCNICKVQWDCSDLWIIKYRSLFSNLSSLISFSLLGHFNTLHTLISWTKKRILSWAKLFPHLSININIVAILYNWKWETSELNGEIFPFFYSFYTVYKPVNI